MRREYGISALRLLSHLVTQTCTAVPVEKQRLVPHLIKSFDRVSPVLQAEDAGTCTVLNAVDSVADCLTSCGRPRDTCILHRFVLRERDSQYRNDHLKIISLMNNLVKTLGYIGELQEAPRVAWEIVEKRQRILSEEHLDTILLINNLANTLSKVSEL